MAARMLGARFERLPARGRSFDNGGVENSSLIGGPERLSLEVPEGYRMTGYRIRMGGICRLKSRARAPLRERADQGCLIRCRRQYDLAGAVQFTGSINNTLTHCQQ